MEHGRFATTRWSMVLAAADESSPRSAVHRDIKPENTLLEESGATNPSIGRRQVAATRPELVSRQWTATGNDIVPHVPPFPEQRAIWTLVSPGTSAMQGPTFDRLPTYGGSRDDFLDRMVREYGASRVVRVLVDDLPVAEKNAVVARLKELSGATSTMVSGNATTLSIQLAPVRDVEALSKLIDFGKVTAVDPWGRTIEAQANKTP